MKLELRKAVRFPALFCRNFLLFWLITCSFALVAQTTTPINCAVATGLSVTDISATGARINFSLTPNASAAVIEIYSTSAPNYLSKGSTTGNFFLLTGLTPATVYHYRIKSECTGGTPGYSTPGEFKTLAASDATPVILTGKGKVKISAGSACEKMIVLDNNTVIVPVESLAFNYKDGQYVEIAYQVVTNSTTSCKEGPAAKITKIAEIVVIPEVCKLAITVAKNGTTPESYTFKTSPQPEGSKYYWYFGDNGTSDAASPTHTYTAGGTYTINLKVLDKTNKVCYGEMKETFHGGTATTTTHTAKGKVKISAGSACEKIIFLDNNTFIVPLESVAFTFKDGQYVEVAYEILKDRVTNCKEGPAVKITKIAEIVVIPEVCKLAITVAKNGTTPESYTFKTSPQPIGSAYYWSFGDGGTSGDAAPTHTYAKAGSYVVTLKVKDSKLNACYGELKTEFLGGSAPNPTIQTAKGKVKISNTEPCGKLIILDNGKVIIPVEMAAGLTLKDGQYVELVYEILNYNPSNCKEGPAANILRMSEIAVIPSTCPTAVITSVLELTTSSARIKFTLPKEAKAAMLGLMEKGSNNWITFQITNMTDYYYDLKNLKAGTKYYYHLKTECASGSAVSQDGYFETKSVTTCTAASYVTVNELTANSARINYKLPADLKSVVVEIREATANDWISISNTNFAATFFDKKELKAGTKYATRIKTICADGSVNYSPEVLFATLGTTACPAAVITSVEVLSATSARINYKLPHSMASATLELLTPNTSAWHSRLIAPGSSYIDLNELKPQTRYYFRIRTICTSGSISYSPETGFTTAGAKTADIGVGATTAPVSLDLAISCFPNPAKDILSVTIYGEGDQLIRVRLANVYGRAVFEGKFPLNTEQRINVQSFPRGIYVLKVSNSVRTNSIKIMLK